MQKTAFTPLLLIVHIAGVIPLIQILVGIFIDDLTANPIQRIEQLTGTAALTFLLLSLACTPIRSVTGWSGVSQRRKALGMYGFLYAALHVGVFIAVDYGLDFSAMLRDVGTKSYIIIGALAFSLLLPVAATSFEYWMKRLGKNWKRLHRLVYLIAPLVIIHFGLVVKGDFASLQGSLSRPFLYGSITVVLLLLRLPPVKRAIIALRGRIQPIIRTGRLSAQILRLFSS